MSKLNGVFGAATASYGGPQAILARICSMTRAPGSVLATPNMCFRLAFEGSFGDRFDTGKPHQTVGFVTVHCR
jgi:hypothetical protein